MPKEVKIVVKGIRRKEPDLRKLARALIQMALAEQQGKNAKQPETETSDEEAS